MMEGGSRGSESSPKCIEGKSVPCDKPTYFINAELHPEGGDSTSPGGIVSSEIPEGAPGAAALAAGEAMPSRYTVSHERSNADIKRQLMKEIRRFGRKYEMMFKLLEEVQGPPEVRIQFVEFTIKEAARFKRHHLIQLLEKKREELLSDSLLYNK